MLANKRKEQQRGDRDPHLPVVEEAVAGDPGPVTDAVDGDAPFERGVRGCTDASDSETARN